MSVAEPSNTSSGTHPEVSLGSLASGFSTPARHLRIPSTSSRTTAQSSVPIATPSPPGSSSALTSRRKTGLPSKLGVSSTDGDDDDGGDLLDTPAADKKRDVQTPRKGAVRPTATTNKGVTLTLRDQEKVPPLSTHGIPNSIFS